MEEWRRSSQSQPERREELLAEDAASTGLWAQLVDKSNAPHLRSTLQLEEGRRGGRGGGERRGKGEGRGGQRTRGEEEGRRGGDERRGGQRKRREESRQEEKTS